MYPVAIEEGTTGMWYGRFIDFPGTHARAREKALLLQELSAELQYHIQWLRRHGEKIITNSTPDIYIAEEVTGIRELGESGGEVALFQYDMHNITQAEADSFFRLMNYSRNDFTALIQSIPHNTLSCVPEGKQRSIVDIIHHVCNAEEFYISRLGKNADHLFNAYSGMREESRNTLPPKKRMDTVRTAALHTLQEILQKGKCPLVFTRSEYCVYPDERWTVHKVLRRFLEHEREHYYNIKEYLHQPPRELP
ncbi:MAG: DinB family protein [Theionarchaea archaeon]|nr:DinB family protein [Theionarchaea archaeon]